MKRRFPGRFLIAEDLRDNPEMTRPLASGGAGFPFHGTIAIPPHTAMILSQGRK